MAYEEHRLGKKPYRVGDLIGYLYGIVTRLAFITDISANQVKVATVDGNTLYLRIYDVKDLSSYPPFKVGDIVRSCCSDWSTWERGKSLICSSAQ